MSSDDKPKELIPEENNENLPEGLSESVQEILEAVPEENRKDVEVKLTRTLSYYKGPLPHAEELVKYENIIPGAADRIFTLTEKEQDHRHNMNKDLVSLDRETRVADFKETIWGKIIGFSALIVMLAFAAYALWKGEIAIAASMSGFTLLSIVGMFVLEKYIEFKLISYDEEEEKGGF